MNDILYKYLIVPWISVSNRQILQKSEFWLMGPKRILRDTNFHTLLADISIHSGGPCDRYCICRYFMVSDKLYCYDTHYRCYPKIWK